MLALRDATWPDLDVDHGERVLLVPIGSIEQHGPHLPVDTDTVVASAVALRLAHLLGTDCLLAPAVPLGASGEHADFPGTISIGSVVLRQVVVELVRSVASWVERVVLVNGHGGNAPGLSQAVLQLRDEGHDVAWVACGAPGGDAHAGRAETSLMLHLEPERVRTEQVMVGNPKPIAELMPLLRRVGVRSLSPSGVLGDPRSASAAEGERLLERIVAEQAARLRAGTVDVHGMLA